MRFNKRCFAILLIFMLLSSMFLFSNVTAYNPAAEKIKVIIAFKSKPGASEMALVKAFGGSIKYTYDMVPAIAATIPEAALAGLQRNPNILRIEPDVTAYAIGETEDIYPWGITKIGADTVQSSGNSGSGVKVAVIDSGVDYNHPDLIGPYVEAGGYDFVNNDNNPMDDNGHGTHVAGTIAAAFNQSGIIGVAPEVEIYALKVLDSSGSGNFSDIIAAIEWCIKNNIQVTNNSYGSLSDPGLTVKEAFDTAFSSGVLHVAAAGNSGKLRATGDNVGYPAKYDSVIAVAATDSNNNRASFSSTGPAVELSAPGVGIYSTIPGGGYDTYSGTSMASPHVAGVAALIISSGVTGPQNIRARLQTTADDLGASGRDSLYGYGLVNAVKATTDTPPPPVTPKSVTVITPSGVEGYAMEGGRTGTANLLVTVKLRDDLNNAVTGAIVSIDLYKNDVLYLQFTGTTGSDGTVTFKAKNAKPGKYSTEVTKITSALTWNNYTPPNLFIKIN